MLKYLMQKSIYTVRSFWIQIFFALSKETFIQSPLMCDYKSCNNLLPFSHLSHENIVMQKVNWKLLSFGMLSHVVWLKFTDISDERAVAIFMAEENSFYEVGNSKFFCLQDTNDLLP
jgi:hypothetical protein